MRKRHLTRPKRKLSKADYNSSSYDRADDNLDSIKRGWKRKIDKAKDALYKAETVLEAVREGKDFQLSLQSVRPRLPLILQEKR